MTVIEEGPPVMRINTRPQPTYSDLADRIEAIEKLGKWIALSKMFGCDSVDQGCVIAADCFLTGMTLIEYQRRNKIVNGKPFKQYDSMLADFHERGGKSRLLESTSEIAKVEFHYQGNTTTAVLTWQELQKEPVPYLGKESEVIADLEAGKPVKLKPKYATPRSRQTMLLARLISSSLRVICPEVNFGTYTEEEFDYVDADSVVTVSPAKEEAKRRIAESKVVTPAEPVVAPAPEPTPTPKDEPASDVHLEALGPVESPKNEPSKPEQIDRIKSVMAEFVNVDAEVRTKIKKKLESHKFSKLADLSQAEADSLLAAMQAKQFDAWLAIPLVGYTPF